MYRLSRKKSKKTSKKNRRGSKRSSKKQLQRKRSSYRFPRTLDVLGLCVTDTVGNYNKIYDNIFAKLAEVDIIKEDDKIKFCMMNLEVNQDNVFECQIKGDYGGNYFVPGVDNKKFDMLILDGCPLRTNITLYTRHRITKMEDNLKDDGYLLITIASRLKPEEVMEDKNRKSSADFFFEKFYKENEYKKNQTYIHVYRKKKYLQKEGIMEDEYEPGSYVPGGPSFHFRFK